MQEPLPWATCPKVDDKPVEECVKSSETAYFWYRTTLDAAPSIEEGQSLKWWIVLCLLLSWVVVFFIVMKGIQSSGKVTRQARAREIPFVSTWFHSLLPSALRSATSDIRLLTSAFPLACLHLFVNTLESNTVSTTYFLCLI